MSENKTSKQRNETNSNQEEDLTESLRVVRKGKHKPRREGEILYIAIESPHRLAFESMAAKQLAFATRFEFGIGAGGISDASTPIMITDSDGNPEKFIKVFQITPGL